MKLTIEAKTKEEKEAADHFLTWLCEAGEQDYWNWMEIREGEEDGKITAVFINYDFENLTAELELGRLDEPEEM